SPSAAIVSRISSLLVDSIVLSFDFFFYFFFFQAEDGIRDFHVTGVQTCALPIFGRDAVLRKKEAGLERRMVQFRLSDPGVMVYHNEPILREGSILFKLTSCAYGHLLGASNGMSYLL